MQDLQRAFYMSPYEEVTEECEVTLFCGFEIAKRDEAYTRYIKKMYVGELLQRRQVQGRGNHPLPKLQGVPINYWRASMVGISYKA